MFEAMALEMKVNEALKTVDYLADQIDASNKRIDELENRVAILTNRVDYLYEDPLP